ncbi:MAG TPA: hypothetical protein VIM75_22235 [Ohtaekwangia sp.]|uniref:hypothetical protein n=1 Tax=Ohtaekwangia sp. TaxID=2066019 RepID=UPI002F94D384
MNESGKARTILYEQPWGYIEYISDIPCINCVIKGSSLSEEVRDRHAKINHYLLEKKELHDKIGLLIDPLEAEPLLEKDIQWLTQEWKPSLSKIGIEYMAVVISTDDLARLTTDLLEEDIEATEIKLMERYFSGRNSALAWLKDTMSVSN